MDAAHKLLKESFGHTAFKPLQEQVIARLLDGKSACILLPTGGCVYLPIRQKLKAD